MNNTSALHLLNKARDGKKNIFMIIEPETSMGRKIPTWGSMLDISSTVLPFLGYSGKVGLGRDLLTMDQQLQQEQDEIIKKIPSWKSRIASFWGLPKIKDKIAIDIKRSKIYIDETKYSIPILLDISENLHFTPVRNFGRTSIFEYLRKTIQTGNKYLWVDDCKDIKVVKNTVSSEGVPISKQGLCLITGDSKMFFYKEQLTNNVTFTASEFRRILNPQKNEIAAVAGGIAEPM